MVGVSSLRDYSECRPHSWLEEIKAGTLMKDIAARYGWQTLMLRQRIQQAFCRPLLSGRS
ncbi:MAG: hypothetical protein CMF06_04490 [Hyphomonas sp.]|nr:hypothetical protein [Hyphomonas sp.]|tara:strand:- start:217 stop:396 length:180 start_codon:yes stop_codon:yes gene_type:complete